MWQYNHTLDPDELMHYGVRGMKWRRQRARNNFKQQWSEANKKARAGYSNAFKSSWKKTGNGSKDAALMERKMQKVDKKVSKAHKKALRTFNAVLTAQSKENMAFRKESAKKRAAESKKNLNKAYKQAKKKAKAKMKNKKK